jgi:hypothetical protein
VDVEGSMLGTVFGPSVPAAAESLLEQALAAD